MSMAPRPHTSPSTSSPPNGSRVPAGRRDRHDVGVAHEAQRRRVGVAALDAGDERAPAGRRLVALDVEAGCPRGRSRSTSAERTSWPDSGVPSLTQALRISCCSSSTVSAVATSSSPVTADASAPNAYGRAAASRGPSCHRAQRVVARATPWRRSAPLRPPGPARNERNTDGRRRSRWRGRPTGRSQPPPSSARKARSTSTTGAARGARSAASRHGRGRRRAGTRRRARPGRPAAPSPRATSTSATRSAQAEPFEGGAAMTMAPPSGTLRRGGCRCCRAARRSARSGRSDGELGAPADRARSPRWRPAPGRRAWADEGVAGIAPWRHRRQHETGGAVTDGRSLAECTARSARPSSTACCTSFTNTPWPPMACIGTSVRASPVVSTRPARRRGRGSRAAEQIGHVLGLPAGERGSTARRSRRRSGPAARQAGRTGRAGRRRSARPEGCRPPLQTHRRLVQQLGDDGPW